MGLRLLRLHGRVPVCTSQLGSRATLISVSNGAYIGEIIGLQLTGYAVAKYGNKKVMGGATVMMIAFVR